jgi:hypothetical protein
MVVESSPRSGTMWFPSTVIEGVFVVRKLYCKIRMVVWMAVVCGTGEREERSGIRGLMKGNGFRV